MITRSPARGRSGCTIASLAELEISSKLGSNILDILFDKKFPSDKMPFAVQFLGRPFAEPTLIKLASGYEAISRHRQSPASTPALPGETFSY